MSVTLDLKKMLAFFNLPPNYNQTQLREAYKALVIKYHPDKSLRVADTPIFQMLTECYRTLLANLQNQVANKDANQLRKEYKNSSSTPSSKPPPQSKNFDIKLFNQLFTENKIKDVYDDGYAEWANSDTSFKERSKHPIVVYKEPQPLVSNIDDLNYYEFGVKRVTDFSAQNRQFMDYRLAHTTDRIIDLNNVKHRKEYKSVQELEMDRANVSHTMSPEEMAEYVRLKAKQEKKEQRQLERQKIRDQQQFEQFQRIQGTFINCLK
jgi:curved DNA-binding protein CbpA